MRPWSELSDREQIELRDDFAKDPFCLTGTCSLEAKNAARCSGWRIRPPTSEPRPASPRARKAKGGRRQVTPRRSDRRS